MASHVSHAVAVAATIAAPSTVLASDLSCRLELVSGSGKGREATLSIAGDNWPDGGTARLRMVGTHRDPEWLDRQDPKPRTFLGQVSDAGGEPTVIFADKDTAGLFSMDYGRKAGLSLHVLGPDRIYFEQFVGFCEGAN